MKADERPVFVVAVVAVRIGAGDRRFDTHPFVAVERELGRAERGALHVVARLVRQHLTIVVERKRVVTVVDVDVTRGEVERRVGADLEAQFAA